MNMIILVPKVVQSYLSRFPETNHNAYGYFNYDNRVVDERVDRHDFRIPYSGPDDFNDADYDSLVKYASQRMNPILMKYSIKVAAEDALNIAIRAFQNGRFDGKINANKFNVLRASLISGLPCMGVMAKKEKKEKEKVLRPRTLKELGLKMKDITRRERVRVQERARKNVPVVYKEKGKAVLKK